MLDNGPAGAVTTTTLAWSDSADASADNNTNVGAGDVVGGGAGGAAIALGCNKDNAAKKTKFIGSKHHKTLPGYVEISSNG